MIPRFKPCLGIKELQAAFSPSSNAVEHFEKAFAKLVKQRQAIAFPYGRTGLLLLLEALGLKGCEVICPAYTCVVVPHAILTSGNEPVFVDSREEDFNMNLDLVPKAITEKTSAIIATSIFGYPVDLDKLDKLQQRYPHITIIQDCAHSFSAEWRGRPVDKSGKAAIYGLNVSKLLTSIFGGMVTTDDTDLAEKLLMLRARHLKAPNWVKSFYRRLYLLAVYVAFNPRVYGWTNWLEQGGYLDRFVRYYDDNVIDMPDDYLIGITQSEAAVGTIQIDRYETIVESRRRISQYYTEHLKGIPGMQLPPLVNGATYSHYVPRVTDRKRLLEFAGRHGVHLGQLIEYCIPEMKAYRDRPGACFEYPVANQMAKTTVNLPLWIDEKKAQEVVSVIEKGARV